MNIFEVFKSAVINIISTIVPANFKGVAWNTSLLKAPENLRKGIYYWYEGASKVHRDFTWEMNF